MLKIDRIYTIQGTRCNGFFVRNAKGKVLAIGADGSSPFVMPSRKRYARDISLCAALLRLTGCPVKWNLAYDQKSKQFTSLGVAA